MQVTLPEMGESVTEGTVAKWLKQPGDPVREGEALVEVTTDKVDAEVPAPASGTLRKIIADAGQTIAVGAPLGEIEVGTDGDGAAKTSVAAPKPAQPAAAPKEPVAARPASPPPDGEPKVASADVSEGAELLARARGIDLKTVQGSGPGGSIRRRDVMEAIQAAQAPTPPVAQNEPADASSPTLPQERGREKPLPTPAQSPTGSIPLRGA